MSIVTTREQRRQLKRDNAKFPKTLQPIHELDWPDNVPPGLVRVWRSRDFLVQEYIENTGVKRLSISRTSIDSGSERWQEGISWDELQRLKREAGYGNVDAVEIYPRDCDIVNVANMRHLFLMNEPLPFAWRKG